MDRDVALVTGPNAPAAARERAAEFFSSVVGGEEAATLRLLVSEIVSEAVERAGTHRRVLQLHLECADGCIHVELTRAGAAANGPASEIRTSILEQSAERWGADGREGGRLWFDLQT